MVAKINEEIAALAKRHGISAVYVFGSMAGEVAKFLEGKTPRLARHGSDIDIAVLPDRNSVLSAKDKAIMMVDLEELLDAIRVDLVVLPEADPFLAVNVVRGERIYCADEYSLDEYELYVLRRAGDLAPYQRERIARIIGGDK